MSTIKSRTIFLFFLLSWILMSCQKVTKHQNTDQILLQNQQRASQIKELDQILNDFTDRSHKYYLPSYPIQLETYESHLFAIKTFEAKYRYFSEYKPLVGVVTEDVNDVDPVNDLLIHIHQKVKKPKQRELLTYEILTKILAYRNLKVGQTLFIPMLSRLNFPKLKTYKVEKIFDLGDKMPCFALVPSEKEKLPPILLFRGTDIKNSASVMADLDLDGPGFSVFLNNEKKLREWAIKAGSLYAKPRVMGYSLGGSFTEYMCIFHSDVLNLKKKYPHVIFNQPGVSKELCDRWYRINQKKRPHLIGYINEGDLVSSVGHLIGKVNQLSLDNLLDPIAAHVTFMSAQPLLYLYPLDLTMKFEKK